jgi:hypothetical protein
MVLVFGKWTAHLPSTIQPIEGGHADNYYGDIGLERLHRTRASCPFAGFSNDLKFFGLEPGHQDLAHEHMVIS